MLEVFTEAFLDTLKLAPVLIALYVLIEFLEAKSSYKLRTSRLVRGRHAPVLGAAAGIVPQCGFSVMATDLYSRRYITVGTLLAVYIATSDEAIPILLSDMDNIGKLLPLILIKFILAAAVGFAVDLFIKPKKNAAKLPDQIIDGEKCEGHSCGCGCCPETHAKNSEINSFLIRPLLHALKVLLFILIVNLALGAVIYLAGEDALENFLYGTKFLQPVLTALIGLIPNCASSVIITQLFAEGAVTLGSAVSGLTVNAGIATAVLFKVNKNLKENFLILSALFAIGVAAGMVISLF